jgi:hypothetical protein
MWIAFQIIAAYIVADAISGLYHWLTDRGLNIKQQVDMFQEHHVTATMTDFDWQTFAAGLPAMILGAWIHSPFLLALGFFGAMTQCTHYYAHRTSGNRVIRAVVRALQETGIIVHPSNHAKHHASQKFDRDFCLLSGWNNFWLNRVVWLFERRAT